MNALTNSLTVRSEQGFAVHRLVNDEVEVAVVAELGAKIISLKDLRTGRDWMWHPPGGLKLFRNRFGEAFSQSPLAGADECLPTIEPCRWQGCDLPDHGEVWNAPWTVDPEALARGMIKTSVRLKISPFDFARTIDLRGNEIHIRYQLNNRDVSERRFLWAFHPLLRLQPDDHLELPASTRQLLDGAAWVDAVASAIPGNKAAKVFASPIREGLAAIANPSTEDRLEFLWNAGENDTLGLWLTRGGWNGHHHFAIEPANAGMDALAAAAEHGRCPAVAAGGLTTWRIRLRLGP
jgi:galactose mutarotase-like enzyme